MSDTPVIRPLTEADIHDFYGKNFPRPCRGFAIDYKGKLAFITGVTIMPTLFLAWADVKPGVVCPTKVVWKTSLELMKRINGLGYPVIYTIANYDLKNAPAFLHRLGWEWIEDSARGKVFRWVQ